MTLSTQLDIAALTDAWNADDYTGILAPYIEIHDFGRRPTPLIHTSIWLLICDENDRREHEAEQATFDRNSRRLGFKDWPHLLAHLEKLIDTDPAAATALYWKAVAK